MPHQQQCWCSALVESFTIQHRPRLVNPWRGFLFMSIRIMSRVWDHADSSLGELLVFLALADHANDKGFCWPGVEGLAKKSRLSERQTRYILRSLEAKGYIKTLIQQGPRGCNMYEITLGEGAVSAPPREGAVSDTQGGNPRHQGGQPIAPESSRTVTEPSVHIHGLSRLSLEEAKEYAKASGIPESDGEWFFYKCEGNGWTNAGKPIKNARATMRAWTAAKYMPSQKNSTRPFSTPKESATQMATRMLKGIQ